MRARAAAWRVEYAWALGALGRRDLAGRARQCGRMATVRDCRECGMQGASVEIAASCGLRTCPWCARVQARELREGVMGALDAHGQAWRAALDEARADARAEVEAAESAMLWWSMRRDGALERGDAAAAAEHVERLTRADARRRRARVTLYATTAAAVLRWQWRLITIAPPWRPLDPWELSVDGLRARAADAWQRWARVWRGALELHGAGAAFARLEISDHGHVHIHALVHGPYVTHDRLAALAGCIVDVRGVRSQDRAASYADHRAAMRAAVREVAKYAAKAPPVRAYAHVAGDVASARTPRSIHPELAAAWTLARWDARDARWYGCMRAAHELAARASEISEGVDGGQSQKTDACPCCGALGALTSGALLPVQEAARLVGPHGWRWRPIRDGTGPPIPPRVKVLTSRSAF